MQCTQLNCRAYKQAPRNHFVSHCVRILGFDQGRADNSEGHALSLNQLTVTGPLFTQMVRSLPFLHQVRNLSFLHQVLNLRFSFLHQLKINLLLRNFHQVGGKNSMLGTSYLAKFLKLVCQMPWSTTSCKTATDLQMWPENAWIIPLNCLKRYYRMQEKASRFQNFPGSMSLDPWQDVAKGMCWCLWYPSWPDQQILDPPLHYSYYLWFWVCKFSEK